MSNGDYGFNRDNDYAGYEPEMQKKEDISGVVESLSKPRTHVFSILALIFGIGSLALGGVLDVFALLLGVAAIVLSIVSRRHLGYFEGMAVAGLVLGICGLVLGITSIILSIVLESGLLDGLLDYIFDGFYDGSDPGASGDIF